MMKRRLSAAGLVGERKKENMSPTSHPPIPWNFVSIFFRKLPQDPVPDAYLRLRRGVVNKARKPQIEIPISGVTG